MRAAPPFDARLSGLDAGEREAIALALDLPADLVLLDETKGRAAAAELGLIVSGTLGVIERAVPRGLLDLAAALGRLRETSFRASPKLLQSIREGPPRR
ncbi:MAG: DUF3368 domain-containing protein [Acidobacteria bacterium]|nr:DUF3368 domain-containing protein [Acidobacteriota bacterium]